MLRTTRRAFETARGFGTVALRMLFATLIAAMGGAPGAVAGEADAARPPVSIKVFVSSRTDVCFDPGDGVAIRKLAKIEQERINAQGGIGGRRLDLEFMDDRRDAQLTIANMRSAIDDPQTLALIGLGNSERAKAVLDALGTEIKAAGIPHLSSITLTSLVSDYPSVFTTRASQDDERLPVVIEFVRDIGVFRPAFLGIKDSLFSTSLVDGLTRSLGALTPLVADHRLVQKDDKLDPAEVTAAIADLKLKAPDLVFLTIGGSRSAAIIKEMVAAGVAPALFMVGSIESLPREITDSYPSGIYQIAWDQIPGVYNDRLRQRMAHSDPAEWIFEGRKISEAPGWATGECKPRTDDVEPDPLADANLRAIGNGSQVADMVQIVAAAARSAASTSDTTKLRAHIIEELKTNYATGRGNFRGSFTNWSFRPTTRAAARVPFIVQLTRGADRTQLAPIQFVRLKNDKLRPVSTLYLDIDMIRTFRIDDNEKSFYAEFYLALRDDGKGNGIDQIEFANAFLDPRTNDRQLTVRVLNDGGKSDSYPDDMRIYQVAGRFMFQPRLENYPFDTQRFSIDIRPKRSDAPFIVQPPPASLRDRGVTTEGWEALEQYVGYDEDFISSVDAKTHDKSVVPFYKATFVWMMTRETTDYFLRVVVPLGFILAVAYLSIFIPLAQFEAIVTIQVTALLSAVALYLSLPAIDADTTTLSDRMFVFAYLAISIMIGISIMRISERIAARPWINRLLAAIHMTAIPLMVILMAFYILQATAGTA